MGWLKRSLYFVVFLAFIATFYSLTSIGRQNNVIKTPEDVEQTTKDVVAVETRGETQVKKQNATPAMDVNRETPTHPTTSKSSSKFRKIEGYVDVISGEILELDCGSCAFVGSSGHVLNSAAGTEIDEHDCVFRMNGAIVRGFEKDVGRRTTLRIVNHSGGDVFSPRGHRSKYFEAEKSDRLVVWGPPQKTPILKPVLVDLVKHYPYLKAFTMTKEKIIALDKQFETETGKNRFKSKSWLTTGWFAFDIVLNACRDNVVVYGLPPGDYCDSAEGAKKFVPYHYYQKEGSECRYYEKHTHHRFAAEKIIYARWAKARGNVSFRSPTWNLTQIDTSQVKF